MHLTLTTINSCYQCLRSKSTNFKIFDSNIVELEVLFESFQMERILSALNNINNNYGWSCNKTKYLTQEKENCLLKWNIFLKIQVFIQFWLNRIYFIVKNGSKDKPLP